MADIESDNKKIVSNKETVVNNHEQGGENDNEHDNTEGEKQDLVNFKGIYYGDDNQKFTDEATGAHFRFEDMVQALFVAKDQRKIIDKKLKVKYEDGPPSDNSARECKDL
jgi:hypothetical protein